MIQIQQELFRDSMPEIEVLSVLHYDELTLNKEYVKLNPNWNKYLQLEDDNNLCLFTIRSDNILVGYSIFFVDTHIHYKDLVVATNDVLFLREDLRLGITGIKLIKFSESVLKTLGVNKITWHVKFAKDFRPILHRMGYADEDVIVGKIL